MKRPLEYIAGGFVLGEVLALLPVGWMAGILAAVTAGVFCGWKKTGRSLMWWLLPVFCVIGMVRVKEDRREYERYQMITGQLKGVPLKAEGIVAGMREGNEAKGLVLELTGVVLSGRQGEMSYGNLLVYVDYNAGNGYLSGDRYGTEKEGMTNSPGDHKVMISEKRELVPSEIFENHEPVVSSMISKVTPPTEPSIIHIGGRVSVKGTLEAFGSPGNPGEFDFGSYYHALGFRGRFFGQKMEVYEEGYSPYFDGIYRLKCHGRRVLEAICSETDRGIFQAVVLGEKTGLSDNIRKLYQRNGIAHLLAISGLHISMIGMGCYRLLRKGGLGAGAAGGLGMAITVSYGVLAGGTGISASVTRAVVMVLMQMAAEYLGRTYDMRTAASVSAVLLLMKSPMLLFQAGFQLSFGAVLSLGIVVPEVERWVRVRKGSGKVILAGAVIQAVTCPVILYHYFEFPVYGIVLNLVVIPLMSYVLLAGILGVAVGTWSVAAGRAAVGTGHYVLVFYQWLCERVQRLPWAVLTVGRPKPWQMGIYGTVWGIMLMIMMVGNGMEKRADGGEEAEAQVQGKHCSKEENHKKREKCRKDENYKKGEDNSKEGNHKEEKNRNKNEKQDTEERYKKAKNHDGERERPHSKRRTGRIWILAAVLTGSMACLMVPLPPSGMEVTFLDVGQGDGICIRTEDTVILTDGGSSDRKQLGEQVLEPFLKSQGISRIDYAIVSHGDMDHISGLMELLEGGSGIGIRCVILPWLGQLEAKEHTIYRRLENLARNHGAEVFWMKQGDEIRAGNLQIRCLYAGEERGSRFGTSDRNEHSLMLEVKYGLAGVLLTGDMSAEGERQWLRKGEDTEIQVLKAAHHGSSYSSCEEFLERIHPTWAVISCGEGNRYGHPGRDTIERLENQGTDWYGTMERGAVMIHTDGEKLEIRSFR